MIAKFRPRKDALLLAEFEQSARDFKANFWSYEGEDLKYVQSIANALYAAAKIDPAWFLDHAATILGKDAPIELIVNRYNDDFWFLCQVMGSIVFKDNLLKHGTLRK